MIIHSKFKDYTVRFADSLAFISSMKDETDALFVIDEKVYALYRSHFAWLDADRLLLIRAEEENKNIEQSLAICKAMANIPAKRNALLVSFGGGIVQDISGFAANILYRGVRWHYIPTTLLAACDSCIGGKSSLNFSGYKNLLGSFYPPDAIIICPDFFATLTPRDYRSGLGEVVKFNIMQGDDMLERMEQELPLLLNKDSETVKRCIHESLFFKKNFIEIDEFDRGERVKLNYAHTFGHALETTTKYAIPHGSAVAIGAIMANHVSVSRELLSAGKAQRIEALLLSILSFEQESEISFDADIMLHSMANDKKRTGTGLAAVLLDNNYELHRINNLTSAEVKEAISHTQNLLLKFTIH